MFQNFSLTSGVGGVYLLGNAINNISSSLNITQSEMGGRMGDWKYSG